MSTTQAPYLEQSDVDYLTFRTLELAHTLLERIGEGHGALISDAFVDFDPSDRERGEFYTELGEQMRKATCALLEVARDSLHTYLYDQTTGQVDASLLGGAVDFFNAAVPALRGGTDPEVAMGLMNMARRLLREAQGRVAAADARGEVEEVAHV